MGLLLVLQIVMIIVVVGSVVFLCLAGCSIYTNLTTGVPWAKIPKENIFKIFEEIKLSKNSLVYDLGCGDGRVILAAEKFGFRARGFELSLYPYLKAKFEILIGQSRAEVVRKNFFKENLSQADAVFIFLTGKALLKLSQKLKHELKPGATVISYGFALPGWQAVRVINTRPSLTYIYKI
jgi:SAM-dependent methyltransferase